MSLDSEAVDWIPDDLAPQCMVCDSPFSCWSRRHHCRSCGIVCCAGCSTARIPLPERGYLDPVRVCQLCFLGREKKASEFPRVPTGIVRQ